MSADAKVQIERIRVLKAYLKSLGEEWRDLHITKRRLENKKLAGEIKALGIELSRTIDEYRQRLTELEVSV